MEFELEYIDEGPVCERVIEPVEVDRGKIAVKLAEVVIVETEPVTCEEGVVGREYCFIAERRMSVLEFVDGDGFSADMIV